MACDKVNKTSVRMGELTHAAGLVKQERSQDDPNAIFVQTGEAVEGPMWRYFGGVPEFSSLSAAGIQVGMIGKREFDYGWGHLKQALDHVSFPMILSNVSISDPKVARRFMRNVIVPAGDLKVGFFAMLSTWISLRRLKPPSRRENWMRPSPFYFIFRNFRFLSKCIIYQK